MTVCVAALADNNRGLILAADKKIGITVIESEPDIEKIRPIHKDWYVMVAGNDIAPALDVIDLAAQKLPTKSVPLQSVIVAMREAFQTTRLRNAETAFVRPHGYTLRQFHANGLKELGEKLFSEIDAKVSGYNLEIHFWWPGLIVQDLDIFSALTLTEMIL